MTACAGRTRRVSWSLVARVVLAFVPIGLICASEQTVRGQTTPYSFYQIDAGFSPAMDINDNGTVIGWKHDPTFGFAGFVWSLATGFQAMTADPNVIGRFPLYTAINDPTRPFRVNHDGTVAGTGCPQGCGTADTRAALWNSTQGLVFLGSFDNDAQNSAAAGINDARQVVGFSSGGGYNNFGPFIWSTVNGLQALSGFTGINGNAVGINNNGQVIGSKGGSRNVPFVWSSLSGETDIPDVIGGAATSVAFAINDSAVVIGRFLASDNTTYRVFRWSESSGTEDLNAPAGYPELMDINNADDIVVTIIQNGLRVPFLYQNGTWTNLNDLMPAGTEFRLQFVEAINNKGWIVGAGTTDPNGVELSQGFVIVPPNRPPAANDAGISTLEDTATSGTLNASDSDGDPLTYNIVANGSKGTATIMNAATGDFSYIPNANTNGTDTFTFKVNDHVADSNIATETVTITPVNDAPEAGNGAVSVNAGASVSGALAAADVDSVSLTYAIVTNGNKGVATITDAGTGAYTYEANVGSSGTDAFIFEVSDGNLSDTATITVTIVPVHCATNISASVAVSKSALKLNRKTGRSTQTVTLKNGDGSVVGPVFLVLDGLSSNAALFNATGATACAAPLGSPYINVDVGPDALFSSRERVTVTLEFANPSSQAVTYTTRVLAAGNP